MSTDTVSTVDARDRIAGAPISWGVCEVPGWGHQLSPERVLGEMQEVGLAATEVGPEGFLPSDPAAQAAVLAEHRLQAVGGFVPVVLHDRQVDPVAGVQPALDAFLASGARTLVLSAASGLDGYDDRPVLDDGQWRLLLANLDAVAAHAASLGIDSVLHPHVGTMVETPSDVERVLSGSSVALCLDTGHLLIGGTDPAELTRQVPDRIAHTHLKDVDASWARRVRAGEVTYTDAVRQGMYRPLGSGDVDVAAIVGALEGRGYQGWYCLEQDTILTGEPVGEGPLADVRASVAHLHSLV